MQRKKCSKCDSALTKARIQSSPGTVGVNKTPSSVLNNNYDYSELIPYVCSSCVIWIFMWRSLESLFNRTFRIFHFRIHYDTSLNLVYSLMSILVMWSNTTKQYFKSLDEYKYYLDTFRFPTRSICLTLQSTARKT